MSISAVDVLKHIRDEARFLLDATAELDERQFIDDEVVKRACVRAIEIIGEAAKKIPDAFKAKYPAVGVRDNAPYLGPGRRALLS